MYPGKDSYNISDGDSTETRSVLGDAPYIFILDGTWSCARKMLRLSHNLQQLRRISFDNRIESKFVIKQQPVSFCLSTIESVYTVLNLLIGLDYEECDTEDFLVPFEKMIEYQIDCYLDPNNDMVRSSESN